MSTSSLRWALAALTFAAGAAQASSYTIVDIGAFSPYGATVTDMNNSGQVVGYSYDWTGDAAFVYSGRTMTNLRASLGALGSGLAMTHSQANGINDAGTVVGYTRFADPTIGFSWSSGTATNLGTLGGYPVAPREINGSGQVVSSTIYNGLYNPGPGWTNLGSSIYPLDINDSGLAGGYISALGGFSWHAAFRAPGGTITDIGTLGGQNSYIYEINNSGQAAGKSHTSGNSYEHGFFYDGSTMVDIGSLVAGGLGYSTAEGINALGQVVGTSATVGPTPFTNCTSGAYHGVLFSGGVLTDVNSLLAPSAGWCLTSASAINDSGQIAGVGINALGQTHAYLLTPVVPVPAAAWLFGSGLAGLAGLRRRRGPTPA